MAYVVPSEARGAHLTFTLSSYVLLGVALRLKGWGANYVSLTASVVSSEAYGIHPTFTLSFASEETCRDPHVLPVVLTLSQGERGAHHTGKNVAITMLGSYWERAHSQVLAIYNIGNKSQTQ